MANEAIFDIDLGTEIDSVSSFTGIHVLLPEVVKTAQEAGTSLIPIAQRQELIAYMKSYFPEEKEKLGEGEIIERQRIFQLYIPLVEKGSIEGNEDYPKNMTKLKVTRELIAQDILFFYCRMLEDKRVTSSK